MSVSFSVAVLLSFEAVKIWGGNITGKAVEALGCFTNLDTFDKPT
jgi:hypothetical protein